MLLALVLPAFFEDPETVRIDAVHFAPGDLLSRNTRLIDFTTGLEDAAMHDCPPITTYRMTMSETAWVREVSIVAGQTAGPGEVLALLSTVEDEPLADTPERHCRTTSAAILQPMAW